MVVVNPSSDMSPGGFGRKATVINVEKRRVRTFMFDSFVMSHKFLLKFNFNLFSESLIL
jgi:hypothetical protein